MARNIFVVPQNVSDGLQNPKEGEAAEEQKPLKADLQSKENQVGEAYAHYTSAVDSYSRELEEEKRLKNEIRQKEADARTASANKVQAENSRNTLQQERSKFYDASVDRVKKNHMKMLDSRQKELAQRMDALKRQCSEEKKNRYNQQQQKRQANNKREEELNTQEKSLRQQITELAQQGNQLGKGSVAATAEPEYPSAKPIMDRVRNRLENKGWNTVQRHLLSAPIQELAQYTNDNKQIALGLVSALRYSVFYQKIDYPDPENDQELNRSVRNYVQMIFGVFYLLGILLSAAFEVNGIRDMSLGMLEAGFTYLVLSFLVKFIGLKANTSVLGILFWILSFLIGSFTSANAAPYVLNEAQLPTLLVIAILASFVPRLFLKHSTVIRLLGKLPFMEKLLIKNAARNADKLEQNAMKQRCSQLEQLADSLAADRLVSIMICCALRFDELYSYVCRAEIANMEAEITRKIQNAQEGLKKIEAARADLAKMQKDIQSQDQVNSYLDQEADNRLAQDLARLEAESGRTRTIDYEANISEPDKARIKEYDKKIKAAVEDIRKCTEKYEQSQEILREASKLLAAQQDKIKALVEAIGEWKQTAGLEDTRDQNGIATAVFYGDICLESRDSKTRPYIIEHHTHPALFSCTDWSSGQVIELIYRLWQGFQKRNIREILDMYVVDPDGLIANDIMMDTSHYDLLSSVRSGFSTEDKNPDKKYLRILSGQKDMEELERKIQNQQNSLHHYVAENGQRFAAASQSKGGEMIELVNEMRKDEKGVSIFPYIVAFILVPQDDAQFAAELPDTMLQRIARDNGYKCGFIPILITKEEHINRKWTWVANCECLNQQTFSVDLAKMSVKRR